MLEKEFVKYEQSLALKELGFDEPCFGYYNIDPQLKTPPFNLVKPFEHEWCLPAPLKQQVFKWFREKYDIHYSIDRECSQHDHKWGYNWSLYNYTGIFDEYLTSHPNAPAGEWIYKTYEEAEDACIDKLIALVKNDIYGAL